MNIIKVLIVFSGLICMTACGGSGGSGSSGSSSSGSSSADDTLFYDAIKLVSPSFSSDDSSASFYQSDITTSWESGNPVYEVFYILQEFDPDTDQGVIDTSNLYKTMWESRGFFANTKSGCTAITEQIIAPPFDFGNEDITYNCAFNSESATGYDFAGAYKELDENSDIIAIDEGSEESGTTAVIKHGLFGFVWVDSGDNAHYEYGTMQAVLDTTTDDLSVDIAVWVDYDEENDYCYRNEITGNTSTHAFTIRAIKGNKVSGSTYTSIVGKGISQGEGEYFLLKVEGSGLDSSKYYCIGAEDSETELILMDPEGSDAVDDNCAEYQVDVDALVPFETSDLACATSDLNPGGSGTAAEGSVFLDFD